MTPTLLPPASRSAGRSPPPLAVEMAALPHSSSRPSRRRWRQVGSAVGPCFQWPAAAAAAAVPGRNGGGDGCGVARPRPSCRPYGSSAGGPPCPPVLQRGNPARRSPDAVAAACPLPAFPSPAGRVSALASAAMPSFPPLLAAANRRSSRCTASPR